MTFIQFLDAHFTGLAIVTVILGCSACEAFKRKGRDDDEG